MVYEEDNEIFDRVYKKRNKGLKTSKSKLWTWLFAVFFAIGVSLANQILNN